MAMKKLPVTCLFLSFQMLTGLARADNTTLPIATYNSDNSSWLVTVPEQWNFKTILNATGRQWITDDPGGFVDDLSYPFPGFTQKRVYVNGSYNGYATNALNYALQQDLNTSISTYSDQTWTLPVVCEWPISGMYSRLNRILYYVLLLFALVVHHHEWLVAGSLAYATTYSGSAAVQAWVQFGVINRIKPPDSAGDNDNEAIMGILAAALLIAVPLINWSQTLRRLRTRPILIYWAIIVFIGYLLVIVGEKQTEFSNGWTRHAGGIMTCHTKDKLPTFKDLGFITHNFISRYNCDDPCYNPITQHPFHSKSSVISRVTCDQFSWTTETSSAYSCFTQCPRDIADNCWVEHDGWTNRDYSLNNVGYYGILPVAVFELFFVLCFGRKSPEEIRDKMFRFFVGKKLIGDFRAMHPEKRKVAKKSWRVIVSMSGALLFYFTAALTYMVCLPFFFFSIVWQERLLRFFPDAEDYNEVAQWLPWVGVLLTLGAAVVGKYHHAWHVIISHYIFRSERRRIAPATKARRRFWDIDIAGWIQRSTWRTRSRLWLEWRDLKDFCIYPFYLVLDTTRERTSDNPTVKYSFAGSLPFPDEEERHCKENYQGPWIKDDNTWKDFNVEFFVEADNRTLKSWERYQRSAMPTASGTPDEHIVYSIYLPAVPSYPDKRTVIAKANVSEVKETILPESGKPNTGIQLTNAIVPGARKPSTVSFGLQPVPELRADAITWPSTDDTATVGNESEQSLTRKSTFLLETTIPQSRMSSIHSPETASTTMTADPNADQDVPQVPPLQVQRDETGRRKGSESSHPAADQVSPVQRTSDEAVGAGAEEPLLSRTRSHESNASE